MHNLQDLILMGKELDIVYIEDDQSLQKETKNILERFFKSVTTANNGNEGLDKIKIGEFDLIITDIEMPFLNGIDMCKEVKKFNPQTPIVVISAYSNTDYLIDAVEVGINYYILKPIQMPHLIQTLYNVVQSIHDKKLAQSFADQEKANLMLKNSEKMLNEITNSSPNPVIVYKDKKIFFINSAFKALFNAEEIVNLEKNELSLSAFVNQQMSVDSVLKESGDYLDYLDDLSSATEKRNKISIKTAQGRKIFLLFVSNIDLDGAQESVMYTFNDITVVEYQRIQLDTYNEHMSDLTYSKYKTTAQSSDSIINKLDF